MAEKTVVITEKPKQAKRLMEAWGGQWDKKVYFKGDKLTLSYYEQKEKVIISCSGHMISLCEPEDYDERYKSWSITTLPFYFTTIEYKLPTETSRKATLKQIENLLKTANTVIHVGDIDDEGQLIVDNILRYYKFKGKVLRLWYPNETVAGFTKALANLKDNREYERFGYRALFRQYNDMMVGFNFTRAFTALLNETTHIGRVKSPIMFLVTQRENANKNHKKIPYFTISGKATTTADLGVFGIHYEVQTDDPQDDKKRLNDKAYSQGIVDECQGGRATIKDIKQAQKVITAPKPFCANSLQQACADLFGFDGKKTMQIAQNLKDKDLISYHRTATRDLSYDNFLESAETLAVLKNNADYVGLFGQIDPKKQHKAFASQGSDKQFTHHGIVPLATDASSVDLTDDEKKVYDLIVKSYLSLFMPDHEYLSYTLLIAILTNNGKERLFKVHFKRTLKVGYRNIELKAEVKADKGDDDKGDESESEHPNIDKVQVGDTVNIQSLVCEEKTTTPPPIYTQKSLMDDIANAGKFAKNQKVREIFIERAKNSSDEQAGGLGTPATTADIVAELFEKGYLELKGKKVFPTDRSRMLCNEMDDRLKYPDLTAIWYAKAQNIENLDDVMLLSKEVFDTLIVPLVKDIKDKYLETHPHKCPNCSGRLVPKTRVSKAKGTSYIVWECDTSRSCPAYFDDKNAPNLSKIFGKPSQETSQSEE